MTPLSPAAQAQKVLGAVNGASSYGPDDCLNESRQIAVAALVAVAPTMECVQDHLKLLAIAAELGGTNNTSQEDYE